MTHAGAHGFHPHQERVRVAVHAQLAHPQPMAALLPFTPKLLARTAVKSGFSGLECRREGLGVHEANHQDFIARSVLHYSWYQATLFAEIEFHARRSPPTRQKSTFSPLSPVLSLTPARDLGPESSIAAQRRARFDSVPAEPNP